MKQGFWGFAAPPRVEVIESPGRQFALAWPADGPRLTCRLNRNQTRVLEWSRAGFVVGGQDLTAGAVSTGEAIRSRSGPDELRRNGAAR